MSSTKDTSRGELNRGKVSAHGQASRGPLPHAVLCRILYWPSRVPFGRLCSVHRRRTPRLLCSHGDAPCCHIRVNRPCVFGPQEDSLATLCRNQSHLISARLVHPGSCEPRRARRSNSHLL